VGIPDLSLGDFGSVWIVPPATLSAVVENQAVDRIVPTLDKERQGWGSLTRGGAKVCQLPDHVWTIAELLSI